MIVVTSDGENIELQDDFVMELNLLKNMYGDLGSFPETLELKNVSSKTLRNMMEYQKTPSQNVKVFFQKLPWTSEMQEILMAADYLFYEKLYKDLVSFMSELYQASMLEQLEAYFSNQP